MRAGYHSYCGCCGNPCSERSDWCDRCLPHVADSKGPPWERTYFAQYGKPCMYEDGPLAELIEASEARMSDDTNTHTSYEEGE